MSAINKILSLLVFCTAALTATASHASSVCDPMSTLNDQAKAARLANQTVQARALLKKILDARKDDFRANYTAALIDLGESRADHTRYVAALNRLVATAATLASQDQPCAIINNFYSIYNSIGDGYYTVLGDYSSARNNFAHGAANLAKLQAPSRKKVLHNLALAAFKQRDYVCARPYFDAARKAGDETAGDFLAAVDSALTAANDKRTCTHPLASLR